MSETTAACMNCGRTWQVDIEREVELGHIKFDHPLEEGDHLLGALCGECDADVDQVIARLKRMNETPVSDARIAQLVDEMNQAIAVSGRPIPERFASLACLTGAELVQMLRNGQGCTAEEGAKMLKLLAEDTRRGHVTGLADE